MPDIERLIRNAYEAGAYAADYDEGKIWSRDSRDPPPEPETADEVVARLLKDESDE